MIGDETIAMEMWIKMNFKLSPFICAAKSAPAAHPSYGQIVYFIKSF